MASLYNIGMDAKRLARLRKRLENLRAGLIAAGPAKIEPARKDAATVGVPDEDEQALTEMLQILASNKNRKLADEVAKIDAALRRMSEAPDDFGVCEECGEDIAPKRLELMPYVTLCTQCQAERDPRRGGSRKSLTDFKD
jgi:DnaK suppressor protein